MKSVRKGVLQRSVQLHRHAHPSATESSSQAPPTITRRGFLAGAGAAAAVGASTVLAPSEAEGNFFKGCRPGAPRPLPAGDPDLGGFRLWLPVPGVEPSTIFDFVGKVAILDLIGDCEDDAGRQLAFRADLRTMEGVYRGLDGTKHYAAYGFI